MARALLVLILLVAAAIRLPGLTDQSLWYDEAATWSQVNGTLAEVFSRTATDNYPPLHNLLTWVSVQLFGDAEWALRLPSALLALLNVGLLYCVGTRIGGRTVGLLAALLLTLSGYHVWYSQEARMYALLAATTTAHAWAVLHFLDKPRAGSTMLLALTGSLLVYSHPYGALNWVALGVAALWVLCRRGNWSALALVASAGLATGLSFLPWALILRARAQIIAEHGFWLTEPTLGYVILQFRKVTSTSTLFLPLLSVFALLFVFRRKSVTGPSPGSVPLLFAWVLIPSVLGVVASLAVQPVFLDRYIIGSLPGFLIVMTLALLAPVGGRRGVFVVSALCLAAGAMTLLHGAPPPRDDWRSMTAKARAEMLPGDCLAILIPFQQVAIDYYLRDPSRCLLREATAVAALEVPASSRIFLFASQVRDEQRQAAATDIGSMRPLAAHYPFGGSDLYVFDRQPSGKTAASFTRR